MLKNATRALRLPFTTASVLPFVFGSLIERRHFSYLAFFCGLIVVVATHLSANLINDYADSKSGVDWQDKNYYKFFGGSKLIQENVFPQEFYLWFGLFFAGISVFFAILLSLILSTLLVIWLYFAIIVLSWLYSVKPIQFSYHKFGEFIIFMMFGPALVMGGYFIQTGVFPDLKSFVLSLPFGFLTTAILFANEVPDFPEDKTAGKFTWVSLVGPGKAYIVYSWLLFFAFFSVALGVVLKFISPLALASCVLVFPAAKAVKILKDCYNDKVKLVDLSKLTISLQALTSIVLIIVVLI
jgi:1,4-dihydroxy-2-naphthoate polyprenyltransferase